MKQILQNIKNGDTELVELPCPGVKAGYLLIGSRVSVISSGTERMLMDFGKANFIEKARQQPDKVRQVLDKVKTDGLIPTIDAVQNKLDQPLPLGYSNAGVVLETGGGVVGFAPGDRVISNGNHAEVVSVPKNLCAAIPDGVGDEEASLTVIAAIALQGLRLARPMLGESFAVIGLGLIGQITVQLLKAHGCKVLALDMDKGRLALAAKFGARPVDLGDEGDAVKEAGYFSRGHGMDGVIITASTKSNDPVHQAAEMCRKRGRIILVGVTGLQLSRADFYEKELSFQVSCSYGPGRYDPQYEEKGHDYPIGFVRWTEQRNFTAILEMLAEKKLDFSPLISHRFEFQDALEAYKLLGSNESSLGILLKYPEPVVMVSDMVSESGNAEILSSDRYSAPVIGFIGAGNFANGVLLPRIKKSGVRLKSIVSSGGLSGMYAARRFGFEETFIDSKIVFADKEINTVFITTRHDSHAELALRALEAGKHVFLEKPLCISREDLARFNSFKPAPGQLFMVGFNRRFSPLSIKMKALLGAVPEPKCMIMTVNAGFVPADSWIHDPLTGGGRILGEVCHFIDLLRYLAAAPVVDVKASVMGEVPGLAVSEDKVSFTLTFADGSLGTVHYFANGHSSFPKERLEVFSGGRVLVLDNFRSLKGYGWPRFKKMGLLQQDKGHSEEVKRFLQAVEGEESDSALITVDEIIEVTETSFKVLECVKG